MLHVVEACEVYADELFVVVHSEEDRRQLAEYYPEDHIVVDVIKEPQCPLVGALTAFRHSRTTYTQLLPCDSPLIHPIFLEVMWGMVEGHDAGVPRWPNGWLEPLHSVYRTEAAVRAAESCLRDGHLRMQCLIDRVGRIIYLSTLALRRFDKKLQTFLNVNTPSDLRRLESLLRKRQRQMARP